MSFRVTLDEQPQIKVESYTNQHFHMEIVPGSSKIKSDPTLDEQFESGPSGNKRMKLETSSMVNFKLFTREENKTNCGILLDKNAIESESYDLSLKNLPEEYKETYEAYIKELTAISSIPILKSVSEEYIKDFKHFNLRYYEDKYCVDFGVKELGHYDTNIRIHTNRIMLIALASGNDIIRKGKPIVNINFVINNIDRSNVKLKGKKKIGSKAVEPGTILCQVKYEGDNKFYNIRAGIRGNIIEINEHIKTNPDLLRTDAKGLGFIAILTPQGRPDYYEDKIKQLNLLTEDEYRNYLLQRPP